ncbi:MAG TPA: hypothetical protein PKX15_01360 [Bacteroidales bacterium]|jgi:uncharacterized lipoprotein YehR (DUF1307 family)|nr:hypothetical protein [Bacteroidales bacterium]HOS15663.1 hypothetical protein [Bacteroidales bacterium]
MKKILLILVMGILITGCENETTYTLKWNTKLDSEITTDILLMELSKDNEIIKNNAINNIQYGNEYNYKADNMTEKCKIHITWSYQGSSTGMWVKQVFYLKEGENTEIILDVNTIRGTTEP